MSPYYVKKEKAGVILPVFAVREIRLQIIFLLFLGFSREVHKEAQFMSYLYLPFYGVATSNGDIIRLRISQSIPVSPQQIRSTPHTQPLPSKVRQFTQKRLSFFFLQRNFILDSVSGHFYSYAG